MIPASRVHAAVRSWLRATLPSCRDSCRRRGVGASVLSPPLFSAIAQSPFSRRPRAHSEAYRFSSPQKTTTDRGSCPPQVFGVHAHLHAQRRDEHHRSDQNPQGETDAHDVHLRHGACEEAHRDRFEKNQTEQRRRYPDGHFTRRGDQPCHHGHEVAVDEESAERDVVKATDQGRQDDAMAAKHDEDDQGQHVVGLPDDADLLGGVGVEDRA